MLNLGLSESAFQALKQALTAIDVVSGQHSEFLYPKAQISLPQCAMSPRKAFFLPGIQIHRNHAVGRIAKQVIAPCPPGIPMLMPGEIIQEAHSMHLPENIMVVASSSVKKASPASSVERQRGSKTPDSQKRGSSRSRTEA